ncbi:hypothetical protein VM1G_12064 [Cytospora mali]|uniref:Uncharacterized protein n=1 Tax=Cytospora mali TaxID=578113 RepID=A0A194VK51_CYTMA|nr:hypothetical protein VM1G_12064 [Valsa mali]
MSETMRQNQPINPGDARPGLTGRNIDVKGQNIECIVVYTSLIAKDSAKIYQIMGDKKARGRRIGCYGC